MKSFLISIGIIFAFGLLISGCMTLKYFSANTRGKIDANEKIKADGNFRIEAYDRFFNQCASVQSIESTLQATKQELASNPSERRRGQLETNITALIAARADAVNTYNADSHKTYTSGQFKSNDLPFQIDINIPTEGITTCAA